MSSITLRKPIGFVGKFNRVLKNNKSTPKVLATLAGGIVAGTAIYVYSNNNNTPNKNNHLGKILASNAGAVAVLNKEKNFKDYQQVYNAIAEKVRDQDDADDGAGRYGLLTRLAWHSSGTYDKNTNTGGSYNGSMIYSPESTDGENAGLEVARDFLVEFHYLFPWLSRGDLWTLGGVVAVQECGGPKIPWRPGRKDLEDRKKVPENGNLPDASRDADYVRKVFTRLGFDERETVALIGAHCLGKCHTDRSGYDGPWGPSFNMFTNDFYVRLLQNWHVRKWDGKKQYEDDETSSFMMLPTDYALKEDSKFLKYVKMYAEDQDLFFKDFSKAFSALLEKGIEYPKDVKPFEFKTLDEQED
ncbi:mitochondrial cytochrome c peroxidase [Hyphopichia burtonii NRRL Y-1933]|uniref:Peroxidase n=1 Tax=Hyphopichia burtonii NRRL Y-1933 TaxID=984485 RepID=A0A1E4RN37_9ASCO|nr:mitochondrial cytochrome c peroxidase [Hyphopichia burtonii NRRL Y-1933]ODV68682.1 mitochondrial cytochrome c peroxidase [Hyphopichia burtonii NRRL Y-1933]